MMVMDTRKKEYCWVLVGLQNSPKQWAAQQRCRTVGSLSSVETEWHWVLAREETRGDVVGFYHTHPAGMDTVPSERDIRTLHAWMSAFGKPLLCLIGSGNRVEGWLVIDDNQEPVRLETVRRVKPGRWEIER